MLRYIIGGVALGAVGYGLKKYFDNYDTCTPYNNTQNEHSPHKHDDIDMSDLVVSDDVFLEENELDGSRKFNETISRLFLSLQNLQEKLSGIENLPELKSAYTSISGEKILKFNRSDSENFNKLFQLFINSKEDLQILCDLNLMIDFTVSWMITNNITKLDLAQSKSDDYNEFKEDEQVFIVKLLELNNRLVKALRELRSATHMQEIATIFKEAAEIYKRYYDEKFFKEKIYE